MLTACKKDEKPIESGTIDGAEIKGVVYNEKNGEMYVDTKEGKERIKISFHQGGYGIGWLIAIGQAFLLEEGNENYYLVIDGDSSLTASLSSKLESGRNLSDIYFGLATNWQNWAAQGYLESLDDLYDSVIPKEEKKVSEKVDETWNVYSNTINAGEYHHYAFPWSDNITGIVYNETMFKQYGWEVPVTVDDLIALCEKIVTDTNGKVAPFVYPGSIGGYFDFLGTAWWLQISGIDGMQQYMNFDSYEVYNPDKALGEAKLQALETFTSVFGPSVNQKYCLKGSNSKNHLAAQISFANGEAAMIPNGNWLEHESADVLSASGIDIKMMGVPYAKDAQKDKDGNYVQVCYGATADFGIVPSEAKNVEGAKKFLLYMCKDEMLQTFTELSGGVRPFDYDVSKCKTSDFAKSCLALWQNSERWFDCSESLLYTAGLAKKFLTQTPYMQIVYDEMDAETFCYQDYSAAKRNWDTYLEKAGIKN